jgi:hypothetical protein
MTNASNSTSIVTMRPNRIARIAAIAVAGATLGITGSFAATDAQDAPAPSATACRATAADLQRAAEAARMLQSQRPELFEQSPRPADYADMRLAAEWAYRVDHLDPDGQPPRCR